MAGNNGNNVEEYEMENHRYLMTEEEAEREFITTGYAPSSTSSDDRERGCSCKMVCLMISTMLNIILLAIFLQPSFCSDMCPSVSHYAGLSWNTQMVIGLENGGNQTEEDYLWNNETNYDRGVVALSDQEVKEMSLPASQRFPWNDTKSLYLLNGYHNLHCLKLLRTALNEYHLAAEDAATTDKAEDKRQRQKTHLHRRQHAPPPTDPDRDKKEHRQTWPWGHVLHCLHVLRDDILCQADDLPRRMGMGQPPRKTGLGQERTCRDWKKLEGWADAHNACWSHTDPAADNVSEIDRYRHCPPGSPYANVSLTMWLEGSGEEVGDGFDDEEEEGGHESVVGHE